MERDLESTLEDLAFLDETGIGATEAARRTNFPNAEAMEKWLERHGHHDLWQRLKNRDPKGTHTSHNRSKQRASAASAETRVCSQCDAEKPLRDFYEQAKGRGGRMAHCIACNNDRPPTEARIIRQRARTRATARLLDLHRDQFTRLLEEETVKARAEHSRLVEVAAAAGNHDAAVARLRPGQRRAGEQDSTERLDVARCESCHTHHDADHECPNCGDTTPAVAPSVKPWQIRSWAREHGVDVPTFGPVPDSVRTAYLDQHAQEAS